MKVKIENNGWINGNDNRICLQLTREEIGNISRMHPLCSLYANIPSSNSIDPGEILDWMDHDAEPIEGDVKVEDFSWANKLANQVHRAYVSKNPIHLRIGDFIYITDCENNSDIIGNFYFVVDIKNQILNLDTNLNLSELEIECESVLLCKIENDKILFFNVVRPTKDNFKYQVCQFSWSPEK